MKAKIKLLLKPTLFTLGGAVVGLVYYLLVGCPDGACAITSSPVNSMIYMGLIGFLFSGVLGCGCSEGKCDM